MSQISTPNFPFMGIGHKLWKRCNLCLNFSFLIFQISCFILDFLFLNPFTLQWIRSVVHHSFLEPLQV